MGTRKYVHSIEMDNDNIVIASDGPLLKTTITFDNGDEHKIYMTPNTFREMSLSAGLIIREEGLSMENSTHRIQI